MKLITISGLDGSGKSTQINLLKNYLEQKSFKVFYFHAIEQGLAKKIIAFRNKYCLICKLSGKCKVYKEKSITYANQLQIILRRIFLIIDIWRFKKLYKKLGKEKFDYILSDRYFYDSVINIEYLRLNCYPEFILGSSEMPKLDQWQGRQVWYNNIIKPDLALYLQADPKIIMSRERKPDQGLDYLQKKKEIYDVASSKWNMPIVNGNRNKEEIFEEIKKMTDIL